jgi:Bacterial regulatory proteins, luxR family
MILVRMRQYQVAELLSKGKTLEEIADELFIGMSSVKHYMSGLFARLRIANDRANGRAIVIAKFLAGELKPIEVQSGPKPRTASRYSGVPAPPRREKARRWTDDDLRWNRIFAEKFESPAYYGGLHVRRASPLAGCR